VKGIRFRTLARLCAALGCRPRDLIDYDFDPADLAPVEREDED
jgi:putative transcriptional regulator